MPTDFLNDWIGDRDLDLPVDGHFEKARFVAEHEPERSTFESSVTCFTDAVRLEIQRSGGERHPR